MGEGNKVRRSEKERDRKRDEARNIECNETG